MTTRARARTRLLEAALAYPEAYEDHPWGESVAKVNGKVFAFFGGPKGEHILSAKLKQSSEAALLLPFAAPTGYGLHRGGWVTASFGATDDVPVALLLEWIEESYRAVAPRALVKALDAALSGLAPARVRARATPARKTPAKKPAKKAARGVRKQRA